MKTRFLWTFFAGLAIAVAASPASAVAAYLKSTGGGTTCSLAAPCSSMIDAINAAAADGVVVCLDRHQYSGAVFVNITQSVVISCGDGLWQGDRSGLSINTPAGSRVVIEGFVSNASGSVADINFTGQGTLDLVRVRLTNSVGGKNGLNFSPNGPATLRVSDSSFMNTTNSGISITPQAGATNAFIRNTTTSGNAQNGVFVAPAAGASAVVALENVVASGNASGLRSGVGGKVTVRNSAFFGNGFGVFTSGVVDFTDSSASGNGTGVSTVSSASAIITLAGSRIFGNTTGLLAAAGQIVSFGNNEINGNTTDGSPSGPALPLK